MCVKSSSLQSIVRLWPENDTRDMLPQRCPNCGCAEEGAAGVPLRFQMRLQRTVRIIAVCLVLLLGMALATLALLLFGSPALLRQSEQPAMPDALTAPEAVSEKLQSENDQSLPSARLTIKEDPSPEWQDAHGNAHRRGGMSYDSGNLRVPSTGLYRLYLQITFTFEHDNSNINNSGMCDDDGLLYLKITVERRSSSYNGFRPLLVSEDTMRCDQDWTRSMFTSGSFELDAQTQLRVTIQHRQLVKSQDTLSFFGAELISAR